MIPDDAILLRRYAEERVEEAFAEVVRRHLDSVYSSALRRLGGDVQLAQDVAQEVFVALAREAACLSRHPAITGWLHTTTRNAAANVVRAERRRKVREEEIQRMHETLSSESAEADWSRLAPVLEDALDQLSGTDRLAVLLRFVEQRSFVEIGRVLSLTDEAARKRVDRALDKLRMLLERHGIASSAAALGIALTNQAVTAAPVGFAATVTGAALAATPAGAAATATFFGIMSTTKLVISCAAIVGVIAALGLASYEYHLRNKSDAALAIAAEKDATLLAERNALEVEARAVEADAVRLKKDAAEARIAQVATESRNAAARSDAAKAAAAWDPEKAGKAFLDRHPEAKQAFREYVLAGMRSRYGALLKTLRLTPEQSDKFALLMITRNKLGTTGPDGKYILYSLDPDNPTLNEDNDLRELLGEQGWQKYIEYTNISPARERTTEVANILAFTDSQLTPEQSDRLVAILASNLSNVSGTTLRGFNWDTVFSETREILSPTQQMALESMRAKEDFQLAFNIPGNPAKKSSK